MRFGSTVVFTALAASSVAWAADAPVVTNPLGAHYLATAPSPGSGGNKVRQRGT